MIELETEDGTRWFNAAYIIKLSPGLKGGCTIRFVVTIPDVFVRDSVQIVLDKIRALK